MTQLELLDCKPDPQVGGAAMALAYDATVSRAMSIRYSSRMALPFGETRNVANLADSALFLTLSTIARSTRKPRVRRVAASALRSICISPRIRSLLPPQPQ